MTERRPGYTADKDAPTVPLQHIGCPVMNGIHQCNYNLLAAFDDGDALLETKRILCPMCRQWVNVSVKRERLWCVTEATACPERGGGE